jgi:hypothetical protein
VGFEGVAFYSENGSHENRRVDEALTGRITRAGSRVRKVVPPGESEGSYSVEIKAVVEAA